MRWLPLPNAHKTTAEKGTLTSSDGGLILMVMGTCPPKRTRPHDCRWGAI